jgi:hypothetical protein
VYGLAAATQVDQRVAGMQSKLEHAERRTLEAESVLAQALQAGAGVSAVGMFEGAGAGANPLYKMDVETNPMVLAGRLQDTEKELARTRKVRALTHLIREVPSSNTPVPPPHIVQQEVPQHTVY